MKYLVANLKMKLISEKENVEYAFALKEALKGVKGEGVQTIICPSFPFLEMFRRKMPKGAALGVQDIFWEERGAYTGEVSPASLLDFGVSYAIVGHSERREFLNETDVIVAKKVSACFHGNVRPIFCVGETEEERTAGKTFEVIFRQVKSALFGVSYGELSRAIVAYEPRWAIGVNRTPSADEILEVVISIRRLLVEKFDRDVVDTLPILYGGSVSADRVGDIVHMSGLSGVLVGRESLDPNEVAKIIRELTR